MGGGIGGGRVGGRGTGEVGEVSLPGEQTLGRIEELFRRSERRRLPLAGQVVPGEATPLEGLSISGALPFAVRIYSSALRIFPLEASAIPAEAEVISTLRAEHYFAGNAVAFTWKGERGTTCILTKAGKWEWLETASQLYDGALLSQGFLKPFNLAEILTGKVGIYRYERHGRSELLVPFKPGDDNTNSKSLPVEAILARQLGRSSHYIRRRYGETFKKMKAAGWSGAQLKELARSLIHKTLDVHGLDRTLEEVHYYTLTAKTREWTPEYSRDFFLEFIRGRESQGLPLELPKYFHSWFNKAVAMLASRGFTREASAALLLHLAKHDPSLKAWEKLPELLLDFIEIETSIGGHSPEDVEVKLDLDLSLLKDVLSKVAEREGVTTAEFYPHLIAALYSRTDYPPNDTLKLIRQLLEDTVLPVSRIQDWVSLNDIQRRTFLTEMAMSGEFLVLYGLPPILPPEIFRTLSVFIFDRIVKGEEIEGYTLKYDPINKVTLELP